MNVVLAITVTIILFLVALTAAQHVGFVPLLGIMALTAIWAAIDVGRLKFSDYTVAFPSNGILAVLFVLGFWMVGFPMFLAAWFAIVRKTAKLRVAPEAASAG
jgi:hypothetical protein